MKNYSILVEKNYKFHFHLDKGTFRTREHMLEVFFDLRSRLLKSSGFSIMVLEWPTELGTDITKMVEEETRS
jgi:hypothetical protein